MAIKDSITPAQLAVLKNRVIWMVVGQPSKRFVEWWDKQEPTQMETAIRSLTKRDAIPLVEAAIMGDYSLIIRRMNKLLIGKSVEGGDKL